MDDQAKWLPGCRRTGWGTRVCVWRASKEGTWECHRKVCVQWSQKVECCRDTQKWIHDKQALKSSWIFLDVTVSFYLWKTVLHIRVVGPCAIGSFHCSLSHHRWQNNRYISAFFSLWQSYVQCLPNFSLQSDSHMQNACKNAGFKYKPSAPVNCSFIDKVSMHYWYAWEFKICTGVPYRLCRDRQCTFGSLNYLVAVKLFLCSQRYDEDENIPSTQNREQTAPFVVAWLVPHSTTAMRHYAATCPAGTCQDKLSAIKAADGSLGRLKPELAWTHRLWRC